jgi:hypothetical protein
MNEERKQKVEFTAREIRAFKIYGVVVVVIAAGLYVVAPKGVGQIVGVLFALCLLPIPPLATYIVRRRKAAA